MNETEAIDDGDWRHVLTDPHQNSRRNRESFRVRRAMTVQMAGVPGEGGRGMRRRARGDRGAALVEFALVAPLLFALLLGTITGGLALSRKNSMTNAVREGARLGATLDQAAPGGWAESVRDRVRELSDGDLQNGQICVELLVVGEVSPQKEWYGSTDCKGWESEPSTGGIPAGDCVVKVWGHRTSDLEVVLWSRVLPLNAGAVSLYERECG